MIRAGIVDPAKVIRLALINAALVVRLLVTTEAIVAETLPKEAPALATGGDTAT